MAARHPFLASMGIGVFERKGLLGLLPFSPQAIDFGKQLSPAVLTAGLQLQGHKFQGLGRHQHRQILL
jgi:hypothetical protein